MMKRFAAIVIATLVSASAAHAQANTDTMFQRLESAKWKPSTLGSVKAWQDLYADDMVTIEYGADPTFSGVDRVVDAKKMMQAGGEDALIKMMDQMNFELSFWNFQHVSPDVVIVTYRVGSPQFGKTHLWATSVWHKVGKTWQTVFYQASRAKD